MVTFVSGGIAVISAARVTDAPFRYISAGIGIVALVTLVSTFMGDASRCRRSGSAESSDGSPIPS